MSRAISVPEAERPRGAIVTPPQCVDGVLAVCWQRRITSRGSLRDQASGGTQPAGQAPLASWLRKLSR
jgi:hypothetical protein